MTPWEIQDMEKFTTISVEEYDAIEILSLDRPDTLNSVTPAMDDELDRIIFRSSTIGLSTRIVIFAGA